MRSVDGGAIGGEAPAGRTVFIVDDDEPVRDSLKLLLESYDLTVRDFGSCPEFLGSLTGDERGCLLLDLHLPVMSGLELLEGHPGAFPRLPVILISGRSDAMTRARALGAGAIAVLEKPFDDTALMTEIERALGDSL
ncbi:MAG: response regulator [Azospirillaceae bacterium]|nr:response regulator [Azospirillaceae bacterium]